MLTTSLSATDAAVENAIQMESQTTNENLWKTFPSKAKVNDKEKAKPLGATAGCMQSYIKPKAVTQRCSKEKVF